VGPVGHPVLRDEDLPKEPDSQQLPRLHRHRGHVKQDLDTVGRKEEKVASEDSADRARGPRVGVSDPGVTSTWVAPATMPQNR